MGNEGTQSSWAFWRSRCLEIVSGTCIFSSTHAGYTSGVFTSYIGSIGAAVLFWLCQAGAVLMLGAAIVKIVSKLRSTQK
jgi:hypothetical protein